MEMVSPEMTKWIDGLRRGRSAMPTDLATRRRLVDDRYAHATPAPDVHLDVVEMEISASGDSVVESSSPGSPNKGQTVAGEWLRAGSGPPRGAVLYLHGGGFVTGRPAHFRRLVAEYARASGWRFFAVDYRLAPEHPFPAALDDAVRAYTWLLDTGERPDRIALGGDSAGAGLAVAALVAIKEAALPQPAGAFLLSPWVDLTLSGDSMRREPSADPWASPQDFEGLARHYLGHVDPRTPLASPLFADLSGLPPLHIEVGSADRLVDDSQRLKQAARAAGVAADLHITEGAVHCFPLHVPAAPESAVAITRTARFLNGLVSTSGREI